ncbi:N-acylamino acid racemase [Listeria cornellensis FSL F6-0969]|uniref:o-succinylbenzoate synthase n=1 Tax=Listeria cornellensis FSL F6-0969 TaxID=1265820 RepID=W7C9X9_9LIST|nr:o-succinylbenzoate synthase [Listeria cornellensis]EUJ32491.1 N-acylamino acid racemase [Listeria cornellensis FSL F6-0969]
MFIKQATLYHLVMPLKETFKTGYGVMKDKHLCIIKLVSNDGIEGYGELDAFLNPWYTEETTKTAILIIKDHLLPMIKSVNLENPTQINQIFQVIRGNEMAKSAVETAVWDVFAKISGQPLTTYLGGELSDISVGVSVGIKENSDELVKVVRRYVSEGYSRVKLKIKPGFDVEQVDKIRRNFPNLSLMVDANSSYRKSDIAVFKQLDQYSLAMIEQPFGVTDFVDHAWLQKQIQTPICLDENIRSLADVRQASELNSAKAINVKIARVGGLTEALKIATFCSENGMIAWCGGMFEAGIGRAHNIALASRAEFTFPGDISASNRYFERDIIKGEFRINNGKITTPMGLGIGVEIDRESLDFYCKRRENIVLN